MPFPGVAFGNPLRISAARLARPPPKRGHPVEGSEPGQAAGDGTRGVLHDEGAAVLVPEEVLAESGHADPSALGDVAVSPAIHAGAGETSDIAAVAVTDPVPGRQAGDVPAGE